MFLVNNFLFLWYNAIVYHLFALQVDIIAPSLIPPGNLSMDKKFIMTIMSFIYEFH